MRNHHPANNLGRKDEALERFVKEPISIGVGASGNELISEWVKGYGKGGHEIVHDANLRYLKDSQGKRAGHISNGANLTLILLPQTLCPVRSGAGTACHLST